MLLQVAAVMAVSAHFLGVREIWVVIWVGAMAVVAGLAGLPLLVRPTAPWARALLALAACGILVAGMAMVWTMGLRMANIASVP